MANIPTSGQFKVLKDHMGPKSKNVVKKGQVFYYVKEEANGFPYSYFIDGKRKGVRLEAALAQGIIELVMKPKDNEVYELMTMGYRNG